MDDTTRPTELRIAGDLLRTVVAHLVAGLPNEAVGLLAVRPEGAAARAVRFYAGTNVDGSPTRYTMEPAEVLAAIRDIDANDWRFGAIVHSHPTTPPTPSETDLREAYYPGTLLVIVGLADVVPVVRAWDVEFGTDGVAIGAVEVAIAIADGTTLREGPADDAPPRAYARRDEAS